MTAGGDPVIDSGQEPRAHLAYRPTRSDYVRINVALIRRSNAAMAVGTFLTVIGGVAVARNGGRVTNYDERPVAEHMKGRDIAIDVDVGVGKGRGRGGTCDLTPGYISLKAHHPS